MTKPDKEQAGESPSQLIDAGIRELGDWRGELPSRIGKLVREADPAKLFDPSLDCNGVKALIRAAVRLDTSASERRSR